MALRALNWPGSNWSWYWACDDVGQGESPVLIAFGLAMRVAVAVWGPVSVPMAEQAAPSFDRSPAQVEAAHQGARLRLFIPSSLQKAAASRHPDQRSSCGAAAMRDRCAIPPPATCR